MSTPTLAASPVQTRGRSLFRRVVVFAILIVLAAALGVFLYARGMAHSALPQLDGALKLAGLSAPVTVIRDSHGVPTIEAASLDDLFVAQGYVIAQDRLFQMDAMRRYAGGELAEVLGEEYVKHDREQRILGLRGAARKSVEAASARDRKYFQDYARGVNAFIETHRDRLPLEFRMLHYSPKPWTEEDSIVIGAGLVQNLNHGYYEQALEKEKILAKVGSELAGDLYVNSSWHDHPPTKGPAAFDKPDSEDSDSGSDSEVTKSGPGLVPVMPQGDGSPLLRPGSNNWVVSGAHTVTGKPLLSNDMHLDHQMPNLWYEVHLHSGAFNVVGVSLPGMPFVIVGHNERIAWGFTNVGPVVEDLYVENVNDKGQYQTPQGWRDEEHRQETIHVKGKADVVVDVSSTRHGPIISELIAGEKRAMALRWTLYDGLHNPFFDLNSAQNWDDFQHALQDWDSAAQNAMYADVDGHIGYHATGHVPIRAAGDGSLPVSGSDDEHEWKGYIPFDKLPNIYDPAWGILGTANGRITPDGYPYSISTQWDSPWRTERIYHVLESGKKLAAADLLALQTDVYSAFDRFCAERFVYALDHAKGLSSRATQARELMRDWDGRMTADSAAATVETRTRRELVRFLLEPKLGAAVDGQKSEATTLSWKDYRWFMASVWLEGVISKQPKRWLPEKYADYDTLLAAAVEAAVSSPELPSNLTEWKWGKFSPLVIQNPVLGRIPFLSRWTGPGLVEQSGGSYTVKQVGKGFGPSERMTADLSNFDQTTLNLVTGEAGNFLSPYYMDQWKAWYEGFTFTIPFSPAAVEQTKVHKLVLQPGS